MRIKPYQPKNFEDFWESRVHGWLLKDIKKCINNNINIGGATLIFCYIDFFGGLIHPNLNEASRNRFYIFCTKYLSKIDQRYDTYKRKLYEDFRCGLAHEAIMKKGTGIFRSDDPQDKDYRHFDIEENALFLDLIELKNDLFQAVEVLKTDLDIDPGLRKNAILRLRNLKWKLPEEK